MVTYTTGAIEAANEEEAKVIAHAGYAEGLGHEEVEEVDEFGLTLPRGDGETTCTRCGDELDPKDTSELDPDDPRCSFCSDSCQITWHETH
jgi:hypothetical protein